LPDDGPLLAIDIGTTKVCALVGCKQAGELHVLGHGLVPCRGVRRGVVVDIERTAAAAQGAAERAQQMAGTDLASASVGITGEHVFSTNAVAALSIAHPDCIITAEDVHRVREAADRAASVPEDREVLHSIPRGYRVDGQEGVQRPEGMAGGLLEVGVHVVAAARNLLRNVERSIEGAGLAVDDIIVEPVATARAVLSPDEQEIGVALLDIGGGTADLALFHRGAVCHTAAIPVAGDYVTQDVAVGLRLAREDAEHVKVEHGSALIAEVGPEVTFTIHTVGSGERAEVAVRALAEIIEPRAREILQLARAEIDRSWFASALAAGVVLTGGGSQLRHLSELAESVLGLPARLGSPRGVPGLSDALGSPIYATAVGLLRYAAERQGEPAASPVAQAAGWWRRLRVRIADMLRW
jgi:cell division protein FtsA